MDYAERLEIKRLIADAIREEFGKLAAEQRAGRVEQAAPLLLDAKQVAAALGIGVRSLWRLHSGGELPGAVKVGRSTRWPREAIESYVERRARSSEAVRQSKARTAVARGLA